MLPSKLRYELFDQLSVKTMRFVDAVPNRMAEGLTKQTYDMIKDDFFKNGSLTSRSKVPELMAAIWTAGRETMLVEDNVDRTTKDALCAVLSQVNECPYCEDMLVSLVHAAGNHDAAKDIFKQKDDLVSSADPTNEDVKMREKLVWLRAVAAPNGASNMVEDPIPFDKDELPEVFGTLLAMSDINRFSHVIMDGSAVGTPLGSTRIKGAALRAFGGELRVTRKKQLEKGRSLSLLPPSTEELPEDMEWARANPRIVEALRRYTATVEREAAKVIEPKVRKIVEASLMKWNGETMPISRSWVEKELKDLKMILDGPDKNIAKLAIILGKAPYQADASLAQKVFDDGDGNEERFIRILAWASFVGARRFIQILAKQPIDMLKTYEYTVPTDPQA